MEKISSVVICRKCSNFPMEFLSKSAYVFMVNAKVRKGVMSDCVQVVFFQGGVIPGNP